MISARSANLFSTSSSNLYNYSANKTNEKKKQKYGEEKKKKDISQKKIKIKTTRRNQNQNKTIEHTKEAECTKNLKHNDAQSQTTNKYTQTDAFIGG